MAEKQLDIEHMIMQARYELTLETGSVESGKLTDMERKQYLNRISELIESVSALLDSNKAIGEKQEQTERKLEEALGVIEQLQSELSKAQGKNASSQRIRYGKNSEKNTGKPSADKGQTKEEEDDDYIENEGKPTNRPEEGTLTEDSSKCQRKEERDLSNRPDHYKTMHADICVFHECDMDKLKELGFEFLRYSRPVDQYDRISKIRQDRYQYAWVRDKDGQEFSFFAPKLRNEESPTCVFKNETDYDMPHLVPHTSGTSSMVSDLAINRYQYCISSGREMYRMGNEKMSMSPQTILNWLTQGFKLLEGALGCIKQRLLKSGTTLYCDETWVDTKFVGLDGKEHYRKRYMWVLVNLTTKVCYYLYGSRKREVIQKFLGGFEGVMMTDAYAAYAYFNKIKNCTHVCCWAHVRRIFYSALKDYKDVMAQEYIDLIGILYKVELENILFHRTEAEVLNARKTQSIPILNELYQKANMLLERCKKNPKVISGKLHQALAYMTHNWKELIGYGNIGNVLIDNNCCERAVRPFTNLRKNFGGFSSENGARVSAAYLTIIETCKLIKKSSLDFLKRYFKMIVEGRRDYEDMMQELLC